jgi:hypothetical protein
MHLRTAAAVSALLLSSLARAGTYNVSNINDTGTGSLRWAIVQANANSGSDTITFGNSLSGQTIKPATPLPTIDEVLTIDGDLDDDGVPDIGLSGENTTSGSGLTISLPIVTSASAGRALFPLEVPSVIVLIGCRIMGLAITEFPAYGICITGGRHHYIQSCHIGVDLAGDTAQPNDDDGISIAQCDSSVIGGAASEHRNIIACGAGNGTSAGVFLSSSDATKVIGNYFGVRRDGTGDLGVTGIGTCGLMANFCEAIQIGGTNAGERNVFGGTHLGVLLQGNHGATVKGNYFGLGPNGSRSIPVTGYCISLSSGTTGVQVGGTSNAARNVFATDGGGLGIKLQNAGTKGNRIQGNLFGSNAAGTRQRPLGWAIMVTLGAGRQIIGGGKPAAGNYFTPGPSSGAITVQSGNGTVVRNNKFGLLKSGKALPASYGVEVRFCRAYVNDNLFARTYRGLYVNASGAEARALRNTFRGCGNAVEVRIDGRCFLGNLSNASTDDDGGNVFRTSNTFHVWNETTNRIRAEGNKFGTTSRAQIEAKIHDKLDDPTVARVDFDPLAGGVHPTSTALALTAAAAVPTEAGAEVAFTLSAAADVTVEILNIAGRAVAAPVRQQAKEAGLQRVLWTGRTLSGTAAPPGRYLVRVTARSDVGEQATALCSLALH